MKKSLLLGCAFLCAVAFGAKAPKYVILIIGDGMSSPQRMTAEEFARASGYGPLAMNALPCQCSTRTRSANSLITDSAASATAIACGEKTDNHMIGQAPDGRRLESVAEFAKKRGMKVGIMTTVPIVHATPAGFYGHRKNRGESYALALDLIDSKFDFFAGGGVYDKFDDKTAPEYRGNVFELAEKAGYRMARTKAEFEALKPGCGRTWSVFTKDALPFAIDRATAYPTLADMLAKAIELLDGPEGFFIMAEGGKVDWAAHANDAATVLREVLSTDEAVKVALKFAAAHPEETLVVTTGDHETGGMAMGFAGTGYKFHVKLLASQRVSCDAFSAKVAERIRSAEGLSFEAACAMLAEDFGFVFEGEAKPGAGDLTLTAEEKKKIRKAYDADVAALKAGAAETKKYDGGRKLKLAPTARRILSDHAGVGWSSGAHTALPTLTTAQGAGAERFAGYLENCDISIRIKELLAK